MRSAAFVLATVVGCSFFPLSAAPASMPPPSPLRQIDHVLLTSDDAPALFELLTEVLQLPVVWPLSNHGGFGSGGVALGNVNLEIVKARNLPPGGPRNRFVGLALEPEPLATSLGELQARNIPHGAPAPFRSRQLHRFFQTLWTTVSLPEVSSDALEVFLCDYAHDESARRQRFREELRARGGGPLSVHSVREIVIGARDLTRAEASWQKLLHPAQASADGTWPIGTGPSIRVVAAAQDEIQEMIVQVTSLNRARDFLQPQHLLERDQAAALVLASPRFPGFKLTLVERPAPRL